MVALATLRRDLEALKAKAKSRSPQARTTLAAIRADRAATLTLAGYDYDERQAAILRSDAPREMVLSCRQFGKSLAAGAAAVAEILLVPRALVLLLAPVQRQSSELFNRVLNIYQNLGEPVPATKRTATELKLVNGARIVVLPGKPETVRCFSGPKLVIIDESAFARDELLTAITPMLSRSRGRLLLLSSPYGQRGFFYEKYTTDDAWRKTKVVAADVPAIPREFLEAERKMLGPRWYSQEYECCFTGVRDAVFDAETVEAALEAGIRPLFLGRAA